MAGRCKVSAVPKLEKKPWRKKWIPCLVLFDRQNIDRTAATTLLAFHQRLLDSFVLCCDISSKVFFSCLFCIKSTCQKHKALRDTQTLSQFALFIFIFQLHSAGTIGRRGLRHLTLVSLHTLVAGSRGCSQYLLWCVQQVGVVFSTVSDGWHLPLINAPRMYKFSLRSRTALWTYVGSGN